MSTFFKTGRRPFSCRIKRPIPLFQNYPGGAPPGIRLLLTGFHLDFFTENWGQSRYLSSRGGASKFLAMFFNVLGRPRRRRAQLATGSADENRSNVCCIPMKMPAQRIVARKCARRTAEAFASDVVRLVALLQSADPGQRRADDRKGGRDPGQRQRYPHEDARAACCRSAVCATHSCDPVCSCARKSGRV